MRKDSSTLGEKRLATTRFLLQVGFCGLYGRGIREVSRQRDVKRESRKLGDGCRMTMMTMSNGSLTGVYTDILRDF